MASSNTKRVGRDLTEGPIFSTLVIFALPIILTNVIQQLYGMVDLAVAGKFVGSIGTVGVNTGGEMADLMLPFGTGLATSAQIYVAQLAGAKDHTRTKKTVSTLLTFFTMLSIVLAVVVILFHTPILNLLNCPEEAMGQASAYMIITALGYPFIFGYNCVCGLLRGMGESKRPLIFIIVAATINIFADILLVAVFRLEAAGTAIATVLSPIGAFCAAFYYLYKSREKFDLKFDRTFVRLDGETLKILLKLAIPQVSRTLLVRFGLLYINANINAYGTEVSAANGVGNKLQKFLDVFTTGLGQASGAMVGQNLGAKKQDRASKTVWCTFCCTMIVACLLSCLSIFIPRQVFGIFTKDPDVLDMGEIYMHVLIAHFIFSAAVTSFQSMVIGSGFASMNFMVGILDGVICKIGLSILFATVLGMGVMGYFWAIGFSRALPALICFIFFISGKWKKRKLLSE